jgi:hypothetical protein
VEHLLAVDLGLRTGIALFGSDGRLRWYRSQNLGSAARLRRAIDGIVAQIPELTWLVAEGDRHLFRLWERSALRRGAQCRLVAAEVWRGTLLLERERRAGHQAKAQAVKIARRVIEWSGVSPVKRLRHDTAEAILIGVWGGLTVGWLDGRALRAAGVLG